MDGIGGLRQNFETTPRNQAVVPRQGDDTPKPQGDQVSIGGSPEANAAPKKWTIMHYSAADNNLLPYIKADVNEMEAVGSTPNMNIIVQLDEGKYGSGCKRYFLQQDNDPKNITSPVLQDMGQVDMANPKVLSDFIKFAAEKYPAENYALIIGDHGAGWQGAISDDSHGTFMSTPQIRQAIEDSGKKIDVLGFDCCLMATSEVAYEMKEAGVGYMVGSQQNEGGSGWPYTPLLTKRSLENVERALRSKLDIPPKELAIKMVDNAKTDQYSLPTLSAMDLSKMKELADATNLFAGQIILTDTPGKVFQDLARKTESFSNGMRDQAHFAELVANSPNITDEKLKKAALAMTDAIKGAVINEEHSNRHPNAHGLSAEIPTYGGVRSGYKDLKYAERTLWDEGINKIAVKAGAEYIESLVLPDPPAKPEANA
jgi:hypothetical protein